MTGLQSFPQTLALVGSFAPYLPIILGGDTLLGVVITVMSACSLVLGAFSSISTRRTLMLMGLTFADDAAPILVTQVSYPVYRTTFGTFKINNTWSWWIPSIPQRLPSVLQIYLGWFVPESPRRLIGKAQDAQMQHMFAYYYMDYNEGDPRTYCLNEILDQIGSTSPTIQRLISGIPAIRNLVRLGRRFLLTSCAGMLIYFLAQTICIQQYQTDAAAYGMIAFIFLFYAAYGFAFRQDPAGSNTFNVVISLALTFNKHVNPIAPGTLKWKYRFVYAVWLAFEGVFNFNILETKNLSLEETAALFDSEEAIERLEQVAHLAEGKNVGTHEMREVNEKGSDRDLPPEILVTGPVVVV
ncbi:hypothetical protein FIBSPDRAFT_915269 [Athelia psychrophila]|uniref:MFS general substrate transporter n=1 Tax=Athelia psychrophila TaxID=1759441 RepID=A0A167U865_9AGAM|nr:hypothetical protein FIBSPDRAFT_915269 [Fibularhizoctonia sp. CBS 109695]